MAETALQVVKSNSEIQSNQPQTFAPRTLAEAIEFAKLISDSGMVPKDYMGKPGAIVVALQMGMEVGLQPMQALQSIAVINGRPSIWGDGALAIVKTHPEFAGIEEDDLQKIKANNKATCTVKRRGQKDVTVTFSQADAVTANLWDKAGPWKQYPARMMQMRARSFAIRDQFPDALKGIMVAEESQDYPTIEGEKTTPAEATAQVVAEDVIGTEKATEFYKAYKAHGWSAEESKKFLKEKFGIEAPKTSKDIPASKLKEAMDWANTNAPIREQAVKLFADLSFTKDEAEKFIAEQKWNWAAIVDVLSAELTKRNSAEQ